MVFIFTQLKDAAKSFSPKFYGTARFKERSGCHTFKFVLVLCLLGPMTWAFLGVTLAYISLWTQSGPLQKYMDCIENMWPTEMELTFTNGIMSQTVPGPYDIPHSRETDCFSTGALLTIASGPKEETESAVSHMLDNAADGFPDGVRAVVLGAEGAYSLPDGVNANVHSRHHHHTIHASANVVMDSSSTDSSDSAAADSDSADAAVASPVVPVPETAAAAAAAGTAAVRGEGGGATLSQKAAVARGGGGGGGRGMASTDAKFAPYNMDALHLVCDTMIEPSSRQPRHSRVMRRLASEVAQRVGVPERFVGGRGGGLEQRQQLRQPQRHQQQPEKPNQQQLEVIHQQMIKDMMDEVDKDDVVVCSRHNLENFIDTVEAWAPLAVVGLSVLFVLFTLVQVGWFFFTSFLFTLIVGYTNKVKPTFKLLRLCIYTATPSMVLKLILPGGFLVGFLIPLAVHFYLANKALKVYIASGSSPDSVEGGGGGGGGGGGAGGGSDEARMYLIPGASAVGGTSADDVVEYTALPVQDSPETAPSAPVVVHTGTDNKV